MERGVLDWGSVGACLHGHGILEQTVQESRAAVIAGGQDDPSTHFLRIYIFGRKRVYNTVVEFCTECFLVSSIPF